MGTDIEGRPRRLTAIEAEEFEGHEEWVPPAGLEVRWEAVDAFRASEARLDRIFDLDRGSDGAAAEVLTAYKR